MSAAPQWEEVCPLDQIPHNSGVCALIDGKQVAVFRIADGEQVFALQNLDPFSNANILSRGLVGDIKGEIVVAGPLYKQHFSLDSGQCLEDEAVKIDTFPVKVEDGKVFVGK
ncbi:MAG: nitrite reductase (NAD(P)H) small subunit [Gammaproteobacteria bacterium]|nr:MAG: nitrite reductase (NAD(P)H) small subunit [Gammaproteobacteria bacterium]